MTQNPIYDDRASAYVGAREALKAANQIKVQCRRAAITENGGTEPAELSDEYWALIAEAGVLAQLARADATVGLLAGNYLVDQQERIRKNRRAHDVARLTAKRNSAGYNEPSVSPADVELDGSDR